MDQFPLAGVRVGLASLDTVNVGALFRRRGCLMECSQVSRGSVAAGLGRCERGWKVFWFDQQRKVDRPICEVCQRGVDRIVGLESCMC